MGWEDTSCEPCWGPRLSEEAENLNSKFPLSQGRLLFEWKSPYYLVPIIYISCPLSQHTELRLHKLNACRIRHQGRKYHKSKNCVSAEHQALGS